MDRALDALTVPVKVILGEESSSRQSAEAFYAAHVREDGLSVVKKTKTFPHLEQPAEFLKCL